MTYAGSPGQPSYPYPPQQEPPRKRWPARHKILTVLIAVASLIIGGAIAGGIAGSAAKTAAPPAATVTSPAASSAAQNIIDPSGQTCPALDTAGYCPGDDPSPAPSGPDMLTMSQSVTITDTSANATEGTVTVSGPVRTTQPQTDFGSAPAHGWFVIVTVTYTADSGYSGGFSYNPLDFYALARGQHFTWDSGNASSALDSSQELDSGTLAAGETAAGKIAFDVPSRHGQIVYAPNLDGQPLAEWSY